MKDSTETTLPAPLLTENQAAELLQLTPRALQAWRYQGRGPRYVKISARAIRYQLDDLQEWIAKRLRRSTSDPGHDSDSCSSGAGR